MRMPRVASHIYRLPANSGQNPSGAPASGDNGGSAGQLLAIAAPHNLSEKSMLHY